MRLKPPWNLILLALIMPVVASAQTPQTQGQQAPLVLRSTTQLVDDAASDLRNVMS